MAAVQYAPYACDMNSKTRRASAHRCIAGLGSEVEVWRDEWGILHIHAAADSDAFLALGYAHAQDRLWQMEATVRKGIGRWAEWAGADGVPVDRLVRLMGGEPAARRDFQNLMPESRSMLESYALGVNAFIATGELPLEYQLLDAKPQPWLPWHSIVVMRQIGFLLSYVWLKLFRAAALPALGAAGVARLRPDDGGNGRTCLPLETHTARYEMDLEALRPAIEELLRFARAETLAGGSNNWVVGGAVTAHGQPILMGDPHRELDVPVIYSQAHVKGATFDAIGLTVPGVPGFPHFCHNHHVAVACTDLQDFYLEQFRDEGHEYRTGTGWAPTRRRSETIGVRNAPDVVLDVFETRHGPVLVGDPATGRGITLKSARLLEQDRSFDCLLRMLRANGWLPVPGWIDEHEWRGIVPFEKMPASINPPSHTIITANNRVAPDVPWPYFSTDCQPHYRAARIAALLEERRQLSVADMEDIFADDLSLPAQLVIERVRRLPLAMLSSPARALAGELMVWNARMDKASSAATAYAHLRVQLARIVAERSGLLDERAHQRWAPFVNAAAVISHLWWVVPTLLRTEDTALLQGLSWDAAVMEALEREAALQREPVPWAEVHTPVPRHPLSKLFPEAAPTLDMGCAPIGGDGDTVLCTGSNPGESTRTTYSSLARYAFNMGDWANSRWIVYQGVSGCPGHPHRGDQNANWAAVRAMPMLAEWRSIRVASHALKILAPV